MKLIKKIKSFKVRKPVNKKRAKAKGFTLVELIIVIAIIGILAAILIPTMTGKVKEARLKTANDAAAKIAEYASIVITELDSQGTPANFSNQSFYDASQTIFSNKISESSSEYTAFKTAMENAMPQLKDAKVHWAVAFNAEGSVVATAYREDGSDYIGAYPEPAKEPNKNGDIGNKISSTLFRTVSPQSLGGNIPEPNNSGDTGSAGNEGNESDE